MKRVRFVTLRLESFGPYTRGVRFHFPPGLGVDVRPNESGKSTLLHGLRAVLFGLPRGSDPEAWTTARFRSWQPARAFTGELILEADGKRYAIQRDFETHMTRVIGPEGESLFHGEANPQGRARAVQRYREVLGEVFAVTDEDLFRSVFCVEQPLPETREVPQEVQRLLTGPGQATGPEVLDRLFASYTRITRFTREAGLHRWGSRPTDQREARRLEKLEAQLRELEERRGEAEGRLDGLRELEERRTQLEERLREVRAEREEVTRLRDDIRAYAQYEEKREELRRERRQLEEARKRWTEEDGKEKRSEAELRERFPELVDVPANFQELLKSGLEAHEAWEEAKSAREEVERELEEIAKELEEVAARLKAEGRLAEMPEGFLETWRNWRALEHQVEELREKLARLQKEKAELEASRPPVRPWFLQPESPVRWLRRMRSEAQRLGDAGRILVSLKRRLETLERGPGLVRALVGPLAAGASLSLLLGLLGKADWILSILAGVAAAAALLAAASRRRASLRTQMRGRLRQQARLLLGVEAPDPLAAPAANLPEVLAACAELVATASGAPPATVGELLERLPDIGDEVWEAWLEEAEAWERLALQLHDLQAKERALTSEETGGGLQTLEAKLEELGHLCEPFRDLSGEEMEERWERIREVCRRRDALGMRQRELEDRLARSREAEAEAQERWEEARRHLAPYLEAADGDPRLVAQRWSQACALREEIQQAQELKRQVLGILEGAEDPEALGRSLEEVQDRIGALTASMLELEEKSATVAAYARLETPEEKDRQRLALEARHDKLAQEEAELAEELRRVEVHLEALRERGIDNLASLELEILATKEEIQQLRRRRDALAMSWRLMKEAMEDLPRSVGPSLAREATRLLSRITRKEERVVTLGTSLEVRVSENGQPCAMAQLSQGARDQLSLAMRLAVARLVAGEVILPLLLDDPFHHFDANRLERVREMLGEVARERQVILWSHDTRFADWGAPIRKEAAP
jgi:DNA repair exonuclease SbcCD ATPase subunit